METQTRENGQAIDEEQLENVIRYQLSNHLGSASLELDEQAAVITYEEFHPYGITAIRSGKNEQEVQRKRYRYTGMERDEATGLNYHGARYYAGWLGRWVSCDPEVLNSKIAIYNYALDAPIRKIDPDGRSEVDVMSKIFEWMRRNPKAAGGVRMMVTLFVIYAKRDSPLEKPKRLPADITKQSEKIKKKKQRRENPLSKGTGDDPPTGPKKPRDPPPAPSEQSRRARNANIERHRRM